MDNTEYYEDLAREMIDEDRERDKMFEEMENMHHLRWELPSALKELQWMRKFMSTDPYDALRGLTRVLAAVSPKIHVQPLGPDQQDKVYANNLEKSLTWFLKSASNRGKAKLVSDIVLSAARHDEVCAQVVMLDVQASAAGMGERRIKAARRHGPFAVMVRNPKWVHSRFSDWMLENVLYARVIKAQEVVDFWGDRAGEVRRMIADSKDTLYVSLFDFWSLEKRVVWGYVGSDKNFMSKPDRGAVRVDILKPEEHMLNFIPWVVRVGGTNLDDEPEFQRHPLLFSVYRAGQWANQNIVQTLTQSETISHAAAPRLSIVGPNPSAVQTDYSNPDGRIEAQPGTSIEQLRPPEIDRALLEINDRLENAMAKSTLPRVLQTGEFPSGTAFATLNLATQSAVKAISPHKNLAEEALADICRHMLYWIDYNGEPLVAYGRSENGMGQQIPVDPETMDVDDLYIEVELTADIPTDKMGRMNAAAIAVERLGMSQERALNEIGVEDPQAETRQRMYEALLENELAIIMQQAQGQAQLKLQMMQQQMQMQMQMQAQQEQQMMQEQMMGQQGQMWQMGQMGQMPMGMQGPGMPGIGGQGFNPAMGGSPPQQANPYATRELQMDSDRTGMPMAEGEEEMYG